MESALERLHKLHDSVQKLETVLQEVWSHIDDLEEDDHFSNLVQKAKQYQKKKQPSNINLEDLCDKLNQFDISMEEIPEDGTAAIDFEDAISELIEWINKNKD